MIRARTLAILIALTIAVIAGIFATKDGGVPSAPQAGARAGDKVFPQLSQQINDVTRVTVATDGGKTVIEQQDGQWVLPDKANFPADIGKVRQIMLGMVDLHRIEPKTRNPELFPQLGLIDPKPGAEDSRSVELADSSGSVKASLLIGKEKPAAGTTRRSEYYVRVGDEEQAWLAEGNVPVPRAANEWLNPQLINIEQKRLASLEVRHSDGEVVRIEKASPDAQDFAIVEPKRDEKIRSAFTVNNMAQSFAQLMLQDVVAADAHPLPEPLHFSAELTTFDGLKVKLDVAKSGDEFLARISADVAEPTPPAANEATSGQPTSTDQPPATKADPAADAEAIRSRGAKWHFKLSSFAVDSIAKRAADLYEVPTDKDADASANP